MMKTERESENKLLNKKDMKRKTENLQERPLLVLFFPPTL